MTQPASDRRKEYPGNDTTTEFDGPRAFSASHIAVYTVDDATGTATLTTAYTLTNTGGRRATTVTMDTAPATGTTLLILRTVPYTQDTDITNQGAYLPEVVEQALDALAQQVQQLDDRDNRTIRLADTVTGVASAEVTSITPLGPVVVNADGTGFEIGDTELTGDMLLRGNLADGADLTKGSALVGFRQNALSGAVARTVADKFADYIHVRDFGATGDGVTDDTDAILAAIAHAKAIEGAIIEFHAGVFLLSETMVVDAPGIILRGRGVSGSASGGGGGKASYRSGASTRILWGGNATGPMYRLTSNAADDGTVSGIQGNAGVEGMLFDCAEVCARGIEIRSWTYATFRHVGVCYATEYGWLITTLENGVPSGAADTQHCEFFHCSYNEINTANPCDAGMVIGKGGSQTSQGNVSLCSFYNLHINVEGAGLALSLENVDNLYFFFYRGQNRTGVGGGGQTVFQAITTGFINQGALLTGPARYCMFFSCSGEFIAKEEPGTGTGSYGNMIFGLTRANGRPLPVVEEGASLVCFETGGSGTAVPLGGSVTGRRRRGHLAHIAATTSIPNGTETAITSYNDTYNTESASLGSGVAGITVPNGIYNCSVEVQASWAVSATGWRQVTLLKNGAVVSPNVFTKVNAPASGGAYVKAVVTDLDVVPGDVLSLSVQHSAGGALNLTAADSWIRVRWY